MQKSTNTKISEIQQQIERHQREIVRLRRELRMIKDVFEEESLTTI